MPDYLCIAKIMVAAQDKDIVSTPDDDGLFNFGQKKLITRIETSKLRRTAKEPVIAERYLVVEERFESAIASRFYQLVSCRLMIENWDAQGHVLNAASLAVAGEKRLDETRHKVGIHGQNLNAFNAHLLPPDSI